MRYGLPLLFCVSLGAACLHGAPAHAQMIGQLNASADFPAGSVGAFEQIQPQPQIFRRISGAQRRQLRPYVRHVWRGERAPRSHQE